MLDRFLCEALQQRRQSHLYRQRRVVESAQGPELQINGRALLAFCSNDYLGMASHPEVAAALARGAETYGAGSGSAHLVAGHSKAHHALEEELADFCQRDRALLFSTGYMANLGVISALLGRKDRVLEDRLNHASLLDGALLSRARLQRYPHADSKTLAGMLQKGNQGRCLVATDGVFSMDGDIAPLPEMAAGCQRHNAWLMVDDAHGIGVLGKRGAGSLEQYDLNQQEVPILMGTLGKAVGTFGAFVAGSETLIETLIQEARSYIFTTATPPAVAEATRTSLRLIQSELWRREKLSFLIARFRSGCEALGYDLMPSTTPIQPILAGSSERALRWSSLLEAQGILVTAIRPPTVPEGSARLRVTLSAAHNEAQVDRLLCALEGVAGEAQCV